ncbi:MAG TPA: hypothetical protein VEH04_17025 [Verrucomicrobiae bacterium]|nr:hypothetical protein [Verrucomicrobiae bacterium]
MRNNISGEIKELTEDEFLDLFDPSVHEVLKVKSKLPGADAVVCFEVLDMSSSQCGHRTALVIGPGCTYQEGHLVDARLGDVPSRFAYPVAIWRVRCGVCSSQGFTPSKTGEGCEYCDGTFGGNPPRFGNVIEALQKEVKDCALRRACTADPGYFDARIEEFQAAIKLLRGA